MKLIKVLPAIQKTESGQLKTTLKEDWDYGKLVCIIFAPDIKTLKERTEKIINSLK